MKYYKLNSVTIEKIYNSPLEAARAVVANPPLNPSEEWLAARDIYPGVVPDLQLFQYVDYYQIGDVVADLPPVEPVADMTLQDAKVAAANMAKTQKDATINAGVIIEINGTSYYFPTQTEDRAWITAAYSKAKSDSEYSVPDWKAGEVINGTPTGNVAWISPLPNFAILALGDAVENLVEPAFTAEKALLTAIDSCQTVAELRALFA